MYKSSVIKHTQQHLIFVEILPIPKAQSSMMSIFLDILVRKKQHMDLKTLVIGQVYC